jgi:carbon monoxide dehydrogenase subunit G
MEGSFAVCAPRAEVWKRITDPALVAECIPGCSKVEMLSPERYRAEVVLAVGPIRANFSLVVEVTRQDPPNRVWSVTRGEEGSRASFLSAESLVVLTDAADGTTHVSYTSEVTVTGRLAKFGLGMMKKKTEAIGLQFGDAFRAKVENTFAAGGAQ